MVCCDAHAHASTTECARDCGLLTSASLVRFGHKPILVFAMATQKKCISPQKWSKLTQKKIGLKRTIFGKHCTTNASQVNTSKMYRAVHANFDLATTEFKLANFSDEENCENDSSQMT